MEPNHPFRSNLEEINTKIVEIVSTLNSRMNEVESYNQLRAVCLAFDPPHPELVEEGRRIVDRWDCKCWWQEQRIVEKGKFKGRFKGKGDASLLLCNDLVIIVQVSRSEGLEYPWENQIRSKPSFLSPIDLAVSLYKSKQSISNYSTHFWILHRTFGGCQMSIISCRGLKLGSSCYPCIRKRDGTGNVYYRVWTSQDKSSNNKLIYYNHSHLLLCDFLFSFLLFCFILFHTYYFISFHQWVGWNIYETNLVPTSFPPSSPLQWAKFILCMNSPIVILRETEHQKEFVSRFQQRGFVTRIAFQSTMLPVSPLAV